MSCPEVLSSAPFARLPFREAAPLWLESRKGQISPRTLSDYTYWKTYLGKFFDDIVLDQIHIGHIEAYQRDRAVVAGPVCINHECGVLVQILKRAGLWTAIEPHYKPLKLPKPKVGCTLEPDEEDRLFRVASSRPRWRVAYWCSLLTAHTTAGPGEIKNLRIGDVKTDSDMPTISVVEGAKNSERVRTIPLNETAFFAACELLKRAKELGAVRPDHYLLPHRAENGARGADPTKPMGSWRRAWENLRDVAGMPHLRQYDLRHHAITRILENPDVSERTVVEVAGHVSNAMMKRYSHIRMRTKKEALDALVRPMAKPQFVLLKGGRKTS
jgi:integrase